MKKTLVFTLSILFSFNIVAQDAATFRQWGDEAMNVIERRMKNTNYSYLYNEGANISNPAYAWGVGVLFKAMIYGGKIGQAERMYNQFHENYYWEDNTGLGGYTAGANERRIGRYYDDNAWIGKDLMDLYDVVTAHDRKALYLERAKMILTFCMSGECPSGGIYFNELSGTDPSWDEYEYDVSSTCATAPTMCLALRIHKVAGTDESEYLAQGKKLYAHEKEKMTWGIGPGFRGYENAVIMQGALLLYEITGEKQYLDDAYTLAHAMVARYVDWTTGRLDETGKWGGHDMTDAFVHMYKIDGNKYWLDVVAGYLVFLRENCLDRNGLYPEYWNNKDQNRPLELLDQASAASAFYKLALAGGGEAKKTPVAIFESKNYNNETASGWSVGLNAGEYTRNDMIALGTVNNRFKFSPQLSSVYIQEGYKVTLYKSDNFKGEELVLTSSTTDLGNWDNRTYSLKVELLSNSVKEYGKTEIKVYPTLFNNEITISNIPSNSSFSLYNVTGMLVLTETIADFNATINAAELPGGIYILRIKSADKDLQVFKLQKK